MEITVQEIWKAQHALEDARWAESAAYSDAISRDAVLAHGKADQNPNYLQAKQRVEELQSEVRKMQAEIGGKVYRLVEEKLTDFYNRLEKLNKRADKLGVGRVSANEVEREEEVLKVRNPDTGKKEERLYRWVYVTISGDAPMVPGFTFIASLDHTIQNKNDDPVTINRVPRFDESLPEIDLTPYRHAENRCDHCGHLRQRNQTYVLYSEGEQKAIQVGSTCLQDFTGANSPEKVARWAEHLAALDSDLQIGSDPDSLVYGSGRDATFISDYLLHVAALIRAEGYQARWRDGERQSGTADFAWTNLRNYNLRKTDRHGDPEYIAPSEEDRGLAQDALKWVRELADKDDIDEFEHNLIAATNSDYMPKKGDGFVAYVVRGFQREQEKEIEREEEAKHPAAPVPITNERIEIVGTVIAETWKDDPMYGLSHKMTVRDDRGFKVWGTVPKDLEIGEDEKVTKGDRVSFVAKVKPGNRDETFGFFKRPTKPKRL